jgi:WD40 repeat protein
LYSFDLDGLILYDVEWSPDGTMLTAAGGMPPWGNAPFRAEGYQENTVFVWDMISGDLIARLMGHTGKVNVLDWSPDSTQIASGSDDGTVLIWEIYR